MALTGSYIGFDPRTTICILESNCIGLRDVSFNTIYRSYSAAIFPVLGVAVSIFSIYLGMLTLYMLLFLDKFFRIILFS